MSVCSEFVEHVWKPGSCKNCFHPRGSHGLKQVPSEARAGTSHALLQGLHGILRNKAENVHEEDGGVTASPYSKPTIAVKPTMITSEVPDAWSETTTMTAESVPQVNCHVSYIQGPCSTFLCFFELMPCLFTLHVLLPVLFCSL